MLRFLKKHALMQVVFVCCLSLAFALAACSASTTPSSVSAEPAPKAVAASDAPTAWSMDVDCAACHTHEAGTLTNEKYLLSMHSDTPCVSCHSDEVKLAAAHRVMSTDVSKLRRLKRTTVSSDLCMECHGTWEDLSELTTESAVVKDSEGTVVNPHTVVTVHNVSHQHDRIVCTSCHQMHADTAIETVANGVCMTCHHKGVYKCGVCHE